MCHGVNSWSEGQVSMPSLSSSLRWTVCQLHLCIVQEYQFPTGPSHHKSKTYGKIEGRGSKGILTPKCRGMCFCAAVDRLVDFVELKECIFKKNSYRCSSGAFYWSPAYESWGIMGGSSMEGASILDLWSWTGSCYQTQCKVCKLNVIWAHFGADLLP